MNKVLHAAESFLVSLARRSIAFQSFLFFSKMINTFELKVTTGITGGFIPAIPSRIVVLNASLPTVAVENYVQSFGGTEKIGMANYVKSSCSLDS